MKLVSTSQSREVLGLLFDNVTLLNLILSSDRPFGNAVLAGVLRTRTVVWDSCVSCSTPLPLSKPPRKAANAPGWSCASLAAGMSTEWSPLAGWSYSTGTMAFSAMTRLYHNPLSFTVRCCVSKSTYTMPNRLIYPKAHSKLSISDQAK